MTGYIDLHCHILPGLDDGPSDPAAAAALVQGLAELGFTGFYPTPHQKSGAWAPTAQERQAAGDALVAALDRKDLEIHPAGGENMWDGLFLERLSPERPGQAEPESYPTYPGGKALLVEFSPDGLPPLLEELLFQHRITRGQLVVVAHLERYPVAADRSRVETLGRSAALLVNLSTLGGMTGWGGRRLARRLVKQGLIHAAATDAHGPEDLRFCRAGIDWLRAALGEAAVRTLLFDNPQRILAGDLPEP